MRFEKLLIHRCTLMIPGQVTGKDLYNRDIIEDVQTANVPCRVDQIKRRVSNDTYGTDVIVENVLFLPSSQQVVDSMRVQDVKDQSGNDVLPGIFSVENINPVFARRRLHHYELTLKKESDSGG